MSSSFQPDILLVEDSESDAELTTRELIAHLSRISIHHVRDGEEALEFIFGTGKSAVVPKSSRRPRVILLDIQMPKVNGLEVLEKIKENPETKTIPVVMLTSSNQNPDIKRAFELGANSYIVKPVMFNDFSNTIRSLGKYWLTINEL